MRLRTLLAAAYLFTGLAIARPNSQLAGNSQAQDPRSDNKQPEAKSTPWPPQLEMRVPFEPSAPSGQHIHVMYDLHLTNFGMAPLSLSRIEVLDADTSESQSIATFEAEQLETSCNPWAASRCLI